MSSAIYTSPSAQAGLYKKCAAALLVLSNLPNCAKGNIRCYFGFKVSLVLCLLICTCVTSVSSFAECDGEQWHSRLKQRGINNQKDLTNCSDLLSSHNSCKLGSEAIVVRLLLRRHPNNVKTHTGTILS